MKTLCGLANVIVGSDLLEIMKRVMKISLG
jgi:hypothetical protein